MGEHRCAFDVEAHDAPAVSRLMAHLATGGLSIDDLAAGSPEIAGKIPGLLQDFDGLRLLVESEPSGAEGVIGGAQLYREVRRLAERLTRRVAKSEFQRALVERRATRAQLIGYALEYYWIVKMAPGLIGPALATAQTPAERVLIQDFLRSELGHDRFLGGALEAAGVTSAELQDHQPLPATFAIGASLGSRPPASPSFGAAVPFERAQPVFIDAFDDRCRGFPECHALARPADLNSTTTTKTLRALMASPVDREMVGRAMLPRSRA